MVESLKRKMTQISTANFKERDYQKLHINIKNGVANLSLVNALVNALSGWLMKELRMLLSDLSNDNDAKIILFDRKKVRLFEGIVNSKKHTPHTHRQEAGCERLIRLASTFDIFFGTADDHQNGNSSLWTGPISHIFLRCYA